MTDQRISLFLIIGLISVINVGVVTAEWFYNRGAKAAREDDKR